MLMILTISNFGHDPISDKWRSLRWTHSCHALQNVFQLVTLGWWFNVDGSTVTAPRRENVCPIDVQKLFEVSCSISSWWSTGLSECGRCPLLYILQQRTHPPNRQSLFCGSLESQTFSNGKRHRQRRQAPHTDCSNRSKKPSWSTNLKSYFPTIKFPTCYGTQ